MKRFFKYTAAVIAILIVAVAALFFFVDANQFRPTLEAQLNQALQRSVHLGDLHVSLLSGGASSSELTISDDPAFSTKPFLTSGLLEIGVDVSALIFSRELHVREFTIDDAEVTLIHKPDGSWNFSSLGTAAPAPATVLPPTPAAPEPAVVTAPTELLVKLIRVDNARVHLTDGGNTREFAKVNFELRDFSRTATMPFSLTADMLGGGNIKLTGTGGPIAVNVAETPFNTQLEIDGWDLGASVPDGLLQIRGNANSNGKTAAVTGAIVIDKLKLSKSGTAATHPVALNLALAHDFKTRRGNLARSTIKLGSGTANLQGSYDLGADPTSMDLTLDGTNMPLPELLDFLPSMDVQLPAGSTIKGGTISTNIALRNRGTASSTTGTVKIEKARLENYNLGAKLGVLKQFINVPAEASTEIALVSSDFENNAGGTQLRNIRMDAPALAQLTGTGSISPAHELNFRMKAAIRGTNVPFFIRGTSSNPSFQPDISRFANDQLQEALRDPEGAAKKGNSLVNKAKGLLDFFKKGPKKKDSGQK